MFLKIIKESSKLIFKTLIRLVKIKSHATYCTYNHNYNDNTIMEYEIHIRYSNCIFISEHERYNVLIFNSVQIDI